MNSRQEEERTTGGLNPRQHARYRRLRTLKEYLEGMLFLTPWLIGLLLFVAYPLGYSFFLSLQEVGVSADGSGLKYTYVGADNFLHAFLRDNTFPVQALTFFGESLLMIPIIVVFALSVSVLLNQQFRGRMFFRMVFFLPVIFATGQVLLELFAQIDAVGTAGLPFVEQYDVQEVLYNYLPTYAARPLWGVVQKFVIVLWFSGVQILIFLAGFQTVAPITYEAAAIDGVTAWEAFWKITFPAIVPFIVLNVIYTIVDLATNPFNPVLNHIMHQMDRLETGFGYAAALGWVYFFFIFILIGIGVSFARRLENYEG